ncbi:hypothetical protein VMCG_00921 [Cytospora schulzeri]|uniref:2EXR domain-containing protein n=1 Tax=Cytospora schulzeri TaxID=448051 RepID=A0A423X619_9PEZI|nr:hypothetical protein VMCG_00921 [Valsa malicola]
MPKELHQFTQLPPELRNLIWEYTLPEPRVFDIYPASTSQKTPAQQGLRFNNRLSEPPPAISAVCRESRSFILHHYSPLTLSSTTKFVDLSRDILLLESCLLERDLLRTLGFMSKIPQIRDNIRSLAFGTSWGVVSGIWHPFLGRTSGKDSAGKFLRRLAQFHNLERVVFVLYQEVQFEVRQLPRTLGAWNGHLSQNATIYLAGTKPPPVKEILPQMAVSDAFLRPKDLLRLSSPTLCTIPWTEDRPSLPHVNELLYYPLDLEEENDHVQSLKETCPDWRGGLWPTTRDFRQFKKDLKRAVDTGVEELLCHGTGAAGKCEKRTRKLVNPDAEGDQHPPGKRRRKSTMVRPHIKVPTMEGASLLWRFTLPASDASICVRAPRGEPSDTPCSPYLERDGRHCVP